MKCSFSIANNDISGGEVMGLVAEGFSDPAQILGKTITIKLYEIDTQAFWTKANYKFI